MDEDLDGRHRMGLRRGALPDARGVGPATRGAPGLRDPPRDRRGGFPRGPGARRGRAQSVGRGLQVRRQMFFAALSLAYYGRDPATIDTTALAKELNAKYYPVPWYAGTHFQCNFGHLNGYSRSEERRV